MTEETTGRVFPVKDRRGTAGSLARPLTDEERTQELPCEVRHPDAGGQCWRKATTMVYGLLFCEIHGAEATAGALAELYQDAADFLERVDNPHIPAPNAEAERAFMAARRDMERRSVEYEDAEEPALRRAYPMIPERVCSETSAFDYFNPHGPNEEPTEVYEDARQLLCKCMRLAYEKGEDWLVEVLEHERESASAQLAFALEDYEQKVGTPEERERRREEAQARRDPVAEVLGRVNSDLTSASNRLSEDVPLAAFADEEDYWRASRAIAEAGGLVVRAETLRRKRGNEDRPGE